MKQSRKPVRRSSSTSSEAIGASGSSSESSSFSSAASAGMSFADSGRDGQLSFRRQPHLAGARLPVAQHLLQVAHRGRQLLLRGAIASGASRLRPVVEDAAQFGGKIAFTVRARKGAFKHDAGRAADSPGVRRNVVQRRDSTEERAYAENRGGPGSGEEGFDGREFKAMVDAAGGDVAAAVQKWLVDNDRIEPGTPIVCLEIRAWMPRA
ncbi:hypothetical protein [Streptomyces sp. NPDC048473]|uniref:hypothetical protein n=1 Tax=unclassified Streptomyces TaxID=2593676 RepID=UPI003710C556